MALARAADAGLAARLFQPGSPHALELLRAAWPRVVGPELSRRTEVLALEASTLRVRVPDARWRSVLHRMQGELLSRLRAVAGEAAPRRLGFVEGEVAAPAAEPLSRGEAEEPRRACPSEVAAEAAAITDPDIRARFLETAARYLSRGARPRP